MSTREKNYTENNKLMRHIGMIFEEVNELNCPKSKSEEQHPTIFDAFIEQQVCTLLARFPPRSDTPLEARVRIENCTEMG